MSDVLQLSGVVRNFQQGRRTVEVLKGVDLTIGPGEIVALVAPSGAGKSTLLHIAGLLDTPTAGQVVGQAPAPSRRERFFVGCVFGWRRPRAASRRSP